VPTYCLRNATTRYRYYRCANAQRRGARVCPAPSVSALTLEKFVLNQVRALASDATRLQEMAAVPVGDDFPDRDVEAAGAERLRLVLDPAWEELPTAEQVAILREWVQGVDFDGVNQKVAITFRHQGVHTFAGQEDLR